MVRQQLFDIGKLTCFKTAGNINYAYSPLKISCRDVIRVISSFFINRNYSGILATLQITSYALNTKPIGCFISHDTHTSGSPFQGHFSTNKNIDNKSSKDRY
jgi:hypothetical protein